MTEFIKSDSFASRIPPSPEAKAFRHGIKRGRKRAARKLQKAVEELSACDEAPNLRRQGEALKANLGMVKRGMGSVSLPDYLSSNSSATILVDLDPLRPPKETVVRLFKQASKLEKNVERLRGQVEDSQARLAAIEALVVQVESWWFEGDRVDRVPEILLAQAGTLGLAVGGQSRKEVKAPAPFNRKESIRTELMKSVRCFTSADGYDILVGKTNVDNDILSFRIARGNDWWFHLAPAAGSHVVVQMPGGGALPQETLLDAGTLAIHFSKMRSASKAEVHYTEAKHVRRIKGAPPGKVRLERNKTLSIRMDPSRLARLVKA